MSALKTPQPSFHYEKLASPILILGAAHTGKSQLASKILNPEKKTIVFGTADPKETAFKQRISLLKSHRPANWTTYEENHKVTELLKQLDEKCEQVLIDSLNQWVASRILAGVTKYSIAQLEEQITHETDTIIKALANCPAKKIVIVSSEVASGVTPPGPIPRLFRELTSRVNCRFAAMAASVVMVAAGIPLLIKQEETKTKSHHK